MARYEIVNDDDDGEFSELDVEEGRGVEEEVQEDDEEYDNAKDEFEILSAGED